MEIIPPFFDKTYMYRNMCTEKNEASKDIAYVWQAEADRTKVGYVKKDKIIQLIKIGKITFPNAFDIPEIRLKYGTMTTVTKFLSKYSELPECGIRNLQQLVNNYYGIADMTIQESTDIESIYSNSKIIRSCMAGKSYLNDFYRSFGTTVLYTKNQNNQVTSRALLWRNVSTDSGEKVTFIDRIYANEDDSIIRAYKKYAAEKGYCCRHRQSYEDAHSIEMNGRNVAMELNISAVLPENMSIGPFLDTFHSGHYNEENSRLTLYNYKNGDIDFQNTDTIDTHFNDNFVFSDYENQSIREEDAVYSDPVNSYLSNNNAIWIHGNDWYPIDHEDIITTCNNEYALIDDCIMCANCGEYTLLEYSTTTEENDRTFCPSCADELLVIDVNENYQEKEYCIFYCEEWFSIFHAEVTHCFYENEYAHHEQTRILPDGKTCLKENYFAILEKPEYEHQLLLTGENVE